MAQPKPMPGIKRAVWIAMLSLSIFFLALTCADLQRHGLGNAWFSPRLAAILTLDTAILIASSLSLERASRRLRANQIAGCLRWLAIAFTLGCTFLAGQAFAWHVLFNAGVYVAMFPDSGFFYLVTAAHAAHLLGALALLGWTLTRAWRGRLRPESPLLLDLTRIVWHTLDLTWLYLYVVLIWFH